MKTLKRILKFLLWTVFLFLIWMGYNAFRIYQYASISSQKPTDVAIVLGAGTNDGALSPVFRERANHGIDLVYEGKARYLIFTGGYGEGQSISDSQAAKKYALSKGLTASKIWIEEKSTVTLTNLIYAKKLMEGHGMESALIVSDPYHSKRAIAICQAINLEAYPSPTPTSMYQSWKTKIPYLTYEAFYYSLGVLTGRYHPQKIN